MLANSTILNDKISVSINMGKLIHKQAKKLKPNKTPSPGHKHYSKSVSTVSQYFLAPNYFLRRNGTNERKCKWVLALTFRKG